MLNDSHVKKLDINEFQQTLFSFYTFRQYLNWGSAICVLRFVNWTIHYMCVKICKLDYLRKQNGWLMNKTDKTDIKVEKNCKRQSGAICYRLCACLKSSNGFV